MAPPEPVLGGVHVAALAIGGEVVIAVAGNPRDGSAFAREHAGDRQRVLDGLPDLQAPVRQQAVVPEADAH